jgi:hypothetical protein
MKTNKILAISFSSLSVLSLLASCSSGNLPSSVGKAQVINLSQSAATNKVYVADVGNGQKTPASISFKINLAQISGFNTKASTAGTAAATLDDLTNIKFYLIASDTGSPPTALSGSGFSYTISGTNRTNGFVDVTFTNVAANATGKSYYVTAAGFSSSTLTAANNITNLNAPINDGTEGKYFASVSGGSPAGAVRVTPTTYAISGTTALGIPLKLLDAVSPVIESSVNLTVGDEVTGAPQGSAN